MSTWMENGDQLLIHTCVGVYINSSFTPTTFVEVKSPWQTFRMYKAVSVKPNEYLCWELDVHVGCAISTCHSVVCGCTQHIRTACSSNISSSNDARPLICSTDCQINRLLLVPFYSSLSLRQASLSLTISIKLWHIPCLFNIFVKIDRKRVYEISRHHNIIEILRWAL